jgi:hypothetical protein
MAKEFEQVTIKFDPQDCAALKRVAAAEDRNLTEQIRHWVRKGLKEYTEAAAA